MPSARDLRIMFLLAAAFCGLAGAVLFGGVSEDVLLVAPLLVLIVPMLGGRYVGETALRRLADAVAGRPARTRACARAPMPRRAPARVVLRGLLLATAHASRPPPAPAVTA